MGVLNDLGQKGAELTRRAKDATDMASMSASVGKMNKQLSELYAVLGEKYYEEHVDDYTVSSDYVDLFMQITRMKKEIDRANQYIIDMKTKNTIYGGSVGTKVCPACGKVLEKEARFCTMCGGDVTTVEAPDVPSATVTRNENPDSSTMVTKREQNVNFLGGKLDALEKELERDNQNNE